MKQPRWVHKPVMFVLKLAADYLKVTSPVHLFIVKLLDEVIQKVHGKTKA